MEWIELIIKIGAAITAVIAIWRAIVFFVRLANNIKGIVEDIGTLKKHSHENYLGIKRLTVMSNDMPLGERIIAGNEYIKEGGNGEVKLFIENELHTKEKSARRSVKNEKL